MLFYSSTFLQMLAFCCFQMINLGWFWMIFGIQHEQTPVNNLRQIAEVWAFATGKLLAFLMPWSFTGATSSSFAMWKLQPWRPQWRAVDTYLSSFVLLKPELDTCCCSPLFVFGSQRLRCKEGCKLQLLHPKAICQDLLSFKGHGHFLNAKGPQSGTMQNMALVRSVWPQIWLRHHQLFGRLASANYSTSASFFNVCFTGCHVTFSKVFRCGENQRNTNEIN